MLKKIIMIVIVMVSIFAIMKNDDMDIIGNAADFVAEEHEIGFYNYGIDGVFY